MFFCRRASRSEENLNETLHLFHSDWFWWFCWNLPSVHLWAIHIWMSSLLSSINLWKKQQELSGTVCRNVLIRRLQKTLMVIHLDFYVPAVFYVGATTSQKYISLCILKRRWITIKLKPTEVWTLHSGEIWEKTVRSTVARYTLDESREKYILFDV